MTALFISDLHLDAAAPAETERFFRFVRGEARSARALYILGDLFEAWIGDDAADERQREVIASLAELNEAGVDCFVMPGNRDFLFGDAFRAQSRVQILSDALVLTLYGEEALLMHGDALCSGDRSYQRLRATVRDAQWQRQFTALSVTRRRALSAAARAGSRAHTAALEYQIADVAQVSVEAAMRAAGCSLLIHGHTHRPGIHQFELDGRPATRIVLGAWHDAGSVLRWRSDGYELARLP